VINDVKTLMIEDAGKHDPLRLARFARPSANARTSPTTPITWDVQRTGSTLRGKENFRRIRE
jgi:hypothetical protein